MEHQQLSSEEENLQHKHLLLEAGENVCATTWKFLLSPDNIEKGIGRHNCWHAKHGCKASNNYFQVPLKVASSNKSTTKRGTPRKLKNWKRPGRASQVARICVHILSYWINNHQLPVNNRIDISHLCHDGFCFNPEHLCRESHDLNWDRIHCIGGEHCSHEPKCFVQKDVVVNKSSN